MHQAPAARRLGWTLVIAGAAPFAAGAVSRVATSHGVPGLFCPFREVTGVPCPLCGGTRAFRAAVVGDPAVASYNWFWVALAVASIAAGLLVLVAGPLRAPVWRMVDRARGAPLAATGLLLVTGWAVALANRGAITGT